VEAVLKNARKEESLKPSSPFRREGRRTKNISIGLPPSLTVDGRE